jgi:hypothetical protein
MGLNHEELVHEKNGRDEKLTDVYDARVIRELVS